MLRLFRDVSEAQDMMNTEQSRFEPGTCEPLRRGRTGREHPSCHQSSKASNSTHCGDLNVFNRIAGAEILCICLLRTGDGWWARAARQAVAAAVASPSRWVTFSRSAVERCGYEVDVS